jgi:hypothetical protein
VCPQILLALVHCVSVIAGLPDVMPVHHALWLTGVIVPLLALSFIGTPRDPEGPSRAAIILHALCLYIFAFTACLFWFDLCGC